MTAKQKANRERFKKAIAEAAKIRAKNPKLTQAEAVKKAWAIIYTKKKTEKKVGALPLGFRGDIWGVEFKIVNQFDIYGHVNAIAENTKTGQQIVTFDGKEPAKILSEKFYTHVINNRTVNLDKYSYGEKQLADLKKRIFAFCTMMQKEVKEYNAGKKSTKKKQSIKIEKPKKITVQKKLPVKKSIKKHKKWGTVKTHKRRVAGLHKDNKSHNVNIRVISGINKDVQRSLSAYNQLKTDLKEATKKYNSAKDFTNRFYAKQNVDKLKYELRERKFVLSNLSRELKRVK
jgi:hypothetical protein